MKFKLNDEVVIIAGKDKNKTGKIIKILRKQNKVVVEKINLRTKHIKKTAEKAGEKIQYEAPLSASNAMLIDPKTKKRTRIGYTTTEKGKKQRIAKLSKENV
ncbi:50S ribosomal protein L24 [Candidatus Peregrinibacteria bacterium CG10_big_fil_rev_8_21_14_0_10_36_19]|nr:MAG: 50S ribosomal protein L24 [Candidatus Peregrinibacteria bacterium CG10_big_fil_rev_8_21_14_0_10_36_19]